MNKTDYDDTFVLWNGASRYWLYKRDGDFWREIDSIQTGFSPVLSGFMVSERWGRDMQHVWGSHPGEVFVP